MKFTIVALVAGLAAASVAPGYSAGGDWPAPSKSIAAPAASSPCEEESGASATAKPSKLSSMESAPKPSAPPAAPGKGSETCEVYTETCTVTVTAPYKPWNAANSTAVGAVGTGAGYAPSAASPTKAYYSNAANSMNGGAFAIGAGALAALFL